MATTRIGFIGAGNIAETHAAAVAAIPGLELVAVVDPVAARAAAFAKRWRIARVHQALETLIAEGNLDAVHVLVPPQLHRAVAEPLLAAGISVLLEKPMAQSSQECALLQAAAERGGALLRVNHNQVHHPAHEAARRLIDLNRIGPIRHVACLFNLPLRQLAARQLGHWMFHVPLNLLLEQAVHPLSQIHDLIGPAREVGALALPPLLLGEGQAIYNRWLVSLDCAPATAQLQIALGQTFPVWQTTVTGTDGALRIDYLHNRVALATAQRWIDASEDLRSGIAEGVAAQRQALGNFVTTVAGILNLRSRADPFYLSMKASIARFHDDVARRNGDLRGADGRTMVELCERILHAAGNPAAPATAPQSLPTDAAAQIAVIGGTGFIGTHVVERLVASGRRVAVLARSIDNLPAVFSSPLVRLVRGDARNRGDVEAAIGAASCVINLAHGGGGGSREEIEAALVGSARTVAEVCLATGVKRLVFVSSIAALYLGNPAEIVTGATPPDARAEERGDYARAKVLAERALMELCHARGLGLAILRPGVVIGQGTSPFHSGIGFYNRENHCLGWNNGRNPLPLILVEDTADAIVRAVDAPGIDGKCYNLVSDIRLSARDYIGELARVTRRPLRYHAQSVLKLYGIEIGKAGLKRLTGRAAPWPSQRDLKSRGLVASFDCSDAARDLGWTPVRDRDFFLRRAFADHLSE
jgi:predicted dehydrogenase/nucleoside-diphosphate-sugar epimerase